MTKFLFTFKTIKDEIALFVKVIISTTLLGIIYIIFSIPQYESYISLYPNQQDHDTDSIFENISGIVKQMGLLQSGSLQSNIDISDVIFSRSLHKKLLSKSWVDQNENPLTLLELWELDKPTFFSSLLGRIPSGNKIIEEGILEIRDRLWVEEGLTGLRKVFVKIEDPNISAQVVNYIGEYLHDFISNELMFQAKNNRLFLEQRTELAKKTLEYAEDELKKFQEKYTLAIDDPDIVLQRTRLSRKVNIDQEIYFVLVQQLELARIEELKHRPIVNFIDRGDIPIEPKYPRTVLVLFISVLSGLLIASLYAIYREEDDLS